MTPPLVKIIRNSKYIWEYKEWTHLWQLHTSHISRVQRHPSSFHRTAELATDCITTDVEQVTRTSKKTINSNPGWIPLQFWRTCIFVLRNMHKGYVYCAISRNTEHLFVLYLFTRMSSYKLYMLMLHRFRYLNHILHINKQHCGLKEQHKFVRAIRLILLRCNTN